MRRYMLICMFLYASCSDPASHNTHKQVFRLNMSIGLESLDPAFAQVIYSMWATHMVFNTLVETDEHLALRPSLATHWNVSPDALTYTFYLRNDVYFQDDPSFPNGKGRKMTAADVVYSFYRLIDPKTASTGAWIFNDRVTKKDPFIALNDTTVVIHLQKPFGPFVSMLSMPYCSIVAKEAAQHWGKDFRNHPCGTGPFQLKYWDEGNVCILHKNSHYWEVDSVGVRLPYLDAIQISFYDTKAVEFLLFLQHKLDFVNNVDGSFKDLVLNKDGTLKKEFQNKIDLHKLHYLNTEFVGFLTDTSNSKMSGQATRNVLVRQAINYAIDRNKIVTYFRNGGGIPATGGLTPPGPKGFDTIPSYGYHYDPQKSLELLEKAGYPHGAGLPPVTVLSPDNYADVVNFMATQLQNVGIKLNVEVMQASILKQQMRDTQLVMFRSNWIADYPDPETFLSFFYSKYPAPPNYTRFTNTTFDSWYEQSLNAPDSLRIKLYKKMDSLAIDQAAIVPLYYELLFQFTQKNVTGFTANPMNIIDLKHVRVL